MTLTDLRGVVAKGEKDIRALAEYDRNMKELAAYRASGLTPEQVRAMASREEEEDAPLPLL